MNKKILIGCVFAVLLMLSTPVISSMSFTTASKEIESEKNNVENVNILEKLNTYDPTRWTDYFFGVTDFKKVDATFVSFHFRLWISIKEVQGKDPEYKVRGPAYYERYGASKIKIHRPGFIKGQWEI
jgi:hypothetical protein